MLAPGVDFASVCAEIGNPLRLTGRFSRGGLPYYPEIAARSL